MSECQSVRGEWGEICPDCGQRLPVALPWSYGRPCSKTTAEFGHGWNGGEIGTGGHSRRKHYRRTAPPEKVYKLSEETRAHMAAGQTRRWARERGVQP